METKTPLDVPAASVLELIGDMRERFDARSAHSGQGLPGFAAVFALVDAGVRRIAGVQTRVVMRRFAGDRSGPS